MNGADSIGLLQEGGYTPDEVQAWVVGERQKLTAGGFSAEEIDTHFGRPPADDEPIRELFRAEWNKIPAEAREATTLVQAIEAGWQSSIFGLLKREEVPDVVLPENAGTLNRVASGIANVGLDLPVMATGALLGASGGGGLFSAVTALGGAFALPAGLRYVLMDTYANGSHDTFEEFWELLSGAVVAEFKGWVTGAATGAAGKIAGGIVRPAAYPAEVATMVSVGAGMEGRVPTAHEFVDAAIIVGGLKTSVKIAGKMRETYGSIGRRPTEVLEDTKVDPSITEDLHSKNHEVPRAYKKGEVEVEVEAKPEPVEPTAKAADPVSVEARRLAEPEAAAPTESVVVGGKTISKVKGETPEQTLKRMQEATGEETAGVVEQVSAATADLMNAKVSGRGKAGTPGKTFEELSGVSREAISEIEAKAAAEIEALSKKTRTEGAVDPDIAGKVAGEVDAIASRAAGRIREIMEEGREQREPASKKEESRADKAVDAFRDRLAASTVGLVEKAEARQLVEDASKAAAHTGRTVLEELGPILERRAIVAAAGQPIKGDTPEDRILGRISIGGKDPKPGWSIHDFYTDWFDRLHPLSRAVKEMSKGEELPIVEDAYKLARLHVGVAGKATHFLEHSPIEFGTFERVGKPLKEILEPVKGKTLEPKGTKTDLDLFRTYAASKRAIELEGRGVETGFDAKDTAEVIAKYGKKFEPILTELKEYQTHTLNYLRDSGLIGKDAYKAMREANEDYVPFFRVMEEGGPGGTGKGMKTRVPIFRIKGSEHGVIDPIESIIKNTYLYISLAERNEIGVAFTNLIEKTGNMEYGAKAKPKLRKTVLDEAEKKRLLKAYAEKKGEKLGDKDQVALEEILQEEFAIFRPEALRPGKNQIAVYRDGKREVWDVDRDVAETFAASDAASAHTLQKFLTVPAQLLRVGAIWTPEFIGRNPFRDQVSAFIFSEAGYRPFVGFARGVFSLAGKDKLYQNWLMSGGPMATMTSLDRTYLQKGVRDVMGQTNMREKARNAVTSPINALAAVSEISEQATRIGEFGRVTKGKPRTKEQILKAGLASREVTLDFGRMGVRGSVVNRYIAFFNAQLQGTDKIVRSFKDNPARTSAKVAASVTIPAVTLHLMNRDKEWYKDAPQWQRDLFMLIPVGGTEDRPDVVLRFPKAFEVGVIFGTGAERIVDFILDQDSHAFDGFLESVFRSVTPAVVPTAAAPIIETWANRSIFRNRAIIPQGSERMLPEYQYEPYTTELTKAMGKAIARVPGLERSKAASPAIIDNAIRGYTGGLGNHILRLADAALRKAGVLPDPPRPDDTLADTVFIKAFVMRYPTAGSQSIQDFYDGYRDNQQVIRTIKGLAARGEIEASIMEMNARGGKMVDATEVHEALGAISRVMRLLTIDPNTPGDEKRQLLDEYQFLRIDIARRGNEMLEQVRKIQ